MIELGNIIRSKRQFWNKLLLISSTTTKERSIFNTFEYLNIQGDNLKFLHCNRIFIISLLLFCNAERKAEQLKIQTLKFH